MEKWKIRIKKLVIYPIQMIREPASQMNSRDKLSQGWTPMTDEYMNKKTGTLNKRGRDDLTDLYINNQKFRDGIINFVGDKTRLINEMILDKRFNYNTPNKLGMETLAKFVWSRDYTRGLIEILACYNSKLKR